MAVRQDKVQIQIEFITDESRAFAKTLLDTKEMNKQIAADLGTVEKTIKVHRARVMEKMEVRSLAELVHLTERVGIVPGNSLITA